MANNDKYEVAPSLIDNEDVEEALAQAASLLDFASGVTVAATTANDDREVAMNRHQEERKSRESDAATEQARSPSTSPRSPRSPNDGKAVETEGWRPGHLLRQMKKKVDESDLMKKLKEGPSNFSKFVPTSPGEGRSTVQGEEVRTFFNNLNNPLLEMAVDWKNKRRGDVLKRTMDNHYPNAESVPRYPIFGTVVIENVSLVDKSPRYRKSPYVVFSAEHHRIPTPRAPSKGPYSWPDWATDLDLSDVQCDLHVSLFEAKPGPDLVAAREDTLVGKAILPLSIVLQSMAQSWLKTLFRGETSLYEREFCVELLPLQSQTRMYARCVDGLPTTGISRPVESLGKVRFRLRYEVQGGIAAAIFRVSPARPSNHLPAPTEELMPPVLYQRRKRFIDVRAQYSESLHVLVEGLLSWQDPFATWLWLTLFAQVALFSEVYQLPFFIGIGTVLGSYFVYVRKQRIHGAVLAPPIFSDETTLDPEVPQTLPAKVRSLKKLVSGLQRVLGIVVSYLERGLFALSWEDPFISFLFSILLVVFGLALSIFAWAVIYFAFIWRVVLFVVVMFLHVPTTLQDKARHRLTRIIKMLVSARRSTQLSTTSSRTVDDNAPLDQLLNDPPHSDAVPEARMEADHERRHHREILKQNIKQYCVNLFERIPDSLEIDHRRIAHERLSRE